MARMLVVAAGGVVRLIAVRMSFGRNLAPSRGGPTGSRPGRGARAFVVSVVVHVPSGAAMTRYRIDTPWEYVEAYRQGQLTEVLPDPAGGHRRMRNLP